MPVWCATAPSAQRIATHGIAAMLAAVIAFGCATTPAPRRSASFADPFAYCAAVGTIDAPDSRYDGPAVPAAVADGLRRAFDAPADAPADAFVRGTSWRCMDGKVYACNVGANLPCDSKADTSTTPSPAIASFCKEQPDAEVIPAVVTGRDTIYEWRCESGVPAISRRITHADESGFRADIWHEITSPTGSSR